MATGQQPVYRLDDLVLDTRSQRVTRNGEPLDLPRLSRQLLFALVESAPGPLDHVQIAETVWRGRYVSSGTIIQRVRLLRRSLGESASEPRYIALERGVGYRLIPEVIAVSPPRVPTPQAPPPVLRQFARSLTVARAVAITAAIGSVLIITALVTGGSPEPALLQASQGGNIGVPLAAQEHFKRGEIFYHRRDQGDLQRAVISYRQAIALAPEYAQPWVSLAAVYNLQAVSMGGSLEVSKVRQRHALETALLLDPDLAIAHARLGRLLYLTGDADARARAHLDRAVMLAPEEPMVLAIYAGELDIRGEPKTALAMMEKVVSLHPASALHRLNLITTYLRLGMLESADTQLEVLLSLHPQKREQLGLELATLHLLRLQPQAALDSLSASLRREDRLFIQVLAHHQLREPAVSATVLQQLAGLATPLALARQLEAQHYIEGNVSIDEGLGMLLELRESQPARWMEVSRAGEEFMNSPFIDQDSPGLRSERMLAVHAMNPR